MTTFWLVVATRAPAVLGLTVTAPSYRIPAAALICWLGCPAAQVHHLVDFRSI